MDVIVKTANLSPRILPSLLHRETGLDGFGCYALSGIVDFKNNRLLLWVLIVQADFEEKFREDELVSVEVCLDEFRGGNTKPDFYSFELDEYGHSVIFGDFEVGTDTVCYMGGIEKPTEFIDKLNIRYGNDLIRHQSEHGSDCLTSAEQNSLKRLQERYPDDLQGNATPTED
tara:strand:+ start:5540 stop:6055 length:516 start_codon:yes stop_codon:yes gene_type:complete